MNATTLLTSTAEHELAQFNSAFWSLGLRWQWDAATLSELSGCADDNARIATYIHRHAPHLEAIHDIGALAASIVERKRAGALNDRFGLEALTSA